MKLKDNRICKDKNKAEVFITDRNIQDITLNCEDINCKSLFITKNKRGWKDRKCKRKNYQDISCVRPRWCPRLKEIT